MRNGSVIERAAAPPVGVRVPLCAAQRSVKCGCRSCVAVCPVDAIAFGDQQFRISEQCTGCGICYAVCPTGAVELARNDDRAFASALQAAVRGDGERVARIACGRDAPPPARALVLPCLGRLTEHLVVSALADGAGRVEVKLPACESCPMVRGMAGFERTVETARTLCRLVGRNEAFVLVERFEGAAEGAPAAAPGTAYSRREFFRNLRRQATAAVADALPAEPVVPMAVSEWGAVESRRRSDLLRLLARFPATVPTPVLAEGLPFATVAVNGNCVGCNVCEALCPAGALRREETEQSFALYFEASRCVNCGACAEACYTRAIRLHAPPDLGAALVAGSVEVIRFTKRRCEVCGQSAVRAGEALCFACAKRRRLLRRAFEQEVEA
jgi:ferredoxin